MAKLVHSSIMSLDGYTADENGDFGWGMPDEEVLAFINNLEHGFATYLYGRRMYETMVYWETFEPTNDDPPGIREFAQLWRGADKIVYSRTLTKVSSANTRIEHEFDPETIRSMKKTSPRDISVAGPELASQAMQAGLLDEIHLFVTPVIIGPGKPALTHHSNLELLNVDRFSGGGVHLHYRTTN